MGVSLAIAKSLNFFKKIKRRFCSHEFEETATSAHGRPNWTSKECSRCGMTDYEYELRSQITKLKSIK